MRSTIFALTFISSLPLLAQTYNAGDSKIYNFGNGDEGYYSGSFLSPVGQGGAGKDPHEVKTQLAFGLYGGKTAFEKGTEAQKSDESVLNSRYRANVYSLFSSDYFPNSAWNGTPLVEKVYSIIEGVKGDQNKAKKDAKNHRLLNPTNINDLAQWGNLSKEEDVKKAYEEKYRVMMGQEPSKQQVNEFYALFNAIKNAIPWSGLCNQFSAANANPYFNKVFNKLYDNEGQVYLCQKPITLGEIKEATTLLYDAVSFNIDQRMGGATNYMPSGETLENIKSTNELDFLTKYPPNTYIEGKDLDIYRKRYSSFLYNNLYERMGRSPSGINFCELDKKFEALNRKDYGNERENFSKNQVPIMNLNGAGEVWNSAVTGAQKDVSMYNVYDGGSINSTGVKASNSFAELMQLYVQKLNSGENATTDFNRIKNALLRNYSVLCQYSNKQDMFFAKQMCNQITLNDVYSAPIPGSENMSAWSTFPKTLQAKNEQVDKGLTGLVKSFFLVENGQYITDNKGLPRLKSMEGDYFSNVKIQNVKLNLEYIAQADFADATKGANKSKEAFEGMVVIDNNKNPPEKAGCTWKNVWSYDHNLKSYKAHVPSSFMTLDIPACPSDTKAKNLLDQVQKCSTFKDFLKEYNKWMLEASQGYNPDKIKEDIDEFHKKFPETNVDWTKLKQEVMDQMGKEFIDESKQ